MDRTKQIIMTFTNYTVIYCSIWVVDKHLNVLEIGMGMNNHKYISTMGGGGKPEASLRAFRDELPNASIRGADIDADILHSTSATKCNEVRHLIYINISVNERSVHPDQAVQIPVSVCTTVDRCSSPILAL